MDDTQIEQIIRQYLPQMIHMSLATVGKDGRPYVCELHYAFDDELNLYWMSAKGARHSQEVAANPHVAGNVVTQHALDQPARGVAFEGVVEILEDINADHPAFKAYTGRFASRAQAVLEAYEQKDDVGRRIYKISVSDYYLVDGYATGKPEKHHLAWKGKDN